MKKTACVLLNYRDPAEILPLIESVEKCSWPEKEIIVVENGTGPDAIRFLEDRIGKNNVVSTPVNLGFAGGMNLGIQRALDSGAKFIWILSKDITVEPDCLEKLHQLWPQLKNPGLLGSIIDFNGTEEVYFFRANIDKKGNAKHGNKGRKIAEIPELNDKFGPTDYVNGSCIFTHRNVIEKVGLIPEDYFLYFEDCEWGLRTKRAGYQNYVSYESRVHHRRDRNVFNRTAEYYCRRNSFLFKKRNGFAKPWTKIFELFKLRRLRIKSGLRGQKEMTSILRFVEKDVYEEKSGVGPFR